MAIYDINGTQIASEPDVVNIAVIRMEHPSYTDDQLLQSAITFAQAIGSSAIIRWDGEDIHFSGSTTHICKGFSGIDFNNSKIYMPNYEGGTILSVVPDSTTELTVEYTDIQSTYTTNNSLKGKVFRINDNYSGNASMCFGDRLPYSQFQKVLYSCPTVKTTPDGFYTAGELFMPPTSGSVTCYNIHVYPSTTFVVCNAEIISYPSTNLSLFLSVTRSNVRFHHIKCSGRSNITTFHDAISRFDTCCDIEIDHIYGVNPVQKTLTSGYIIGMYQVTNAYIHDISVGDVDGWGSIGCNNITNTIFERCYADRWDNHYAQYGYNVARDCTFNVIQYGIGNGSLLFENCTILCTDSSNDNFSLIRLRSDVAGVYDGDIIIRNCDFIAGKKSPSKIIIFSDACYFAKPANSSFNKAPKKRRYISKCRIPDGTKTIFESGTATSADRFMFANLVYSIEDTIVPSGTTIITASDQTVTDATVTDYYKKIT